jgi:hypothetical protein
MEHTLGTTDIEEENCTHISSLKWTQKFINFAQKIFHVCDTEVNGYSHTMQLKLH